MLPSYLTKITRSRITYNFIKILAMEMIRVEKVRAKNNVAIVQLNRPNVLNALCEQLRNELTAALKDLDKDDSIGAIVITGSEIGADIKEMQDKGFVDMYMNKSAENLDDISAIRKPIIAAVNGFALGGGYELALMCDITYAADKALFAQPEINHGTLPDAGGTQRWPRVAGKSLAMEICLTGNRLSAQEAKQCGLVSKVFSPDERGKMILFEKVVAEAVKTAEKIANQSPLVVAMVKEAVNSAYELTLQQGLRFKKRLLSNIRCCEFNSLVTLIVTLM
ncbi:unnamed protein product [Toxocara canis]|uniref:Enoyl-CoA hydratase n=1 Tax=Toxocara canis TaxID=6265 RepID=A0A183UUQ7_TOXCA|nr:unnamed protein product [Toxocara canis]